MSPSASVARGRHQALLAPFPIPLTSHTRFAMALLSQLPLRLASLLQGSSFQQATHPGLGRAYGRPARCAKQARRSGGSRGSFPGRQATPLPEQSQRGCLFRGGEASPPEKSKMERDWRPVQSCPAGQKASSRLQSGFTGTPAAAGIAIEL